MPQIDINEARSHLSELLEAALQGAEIIITENDQPLVRLARISGSKPPRQLGTARGQIRMSDDFNDSDEEYSHDLP